jgi:serine/threonine protein kinase
VYEAAVKPGDQFGSYQILHQLGRGLADVYLARRDGQAYPVVLKIIRNGNDAHSSAVIEAERRGARLQQQLRNRSPLILDLYESGQHQGDFFVALEFFPGRTLSEILASEGRLETYRATRYAAEICRHLRILHEFCPDDDSLPCAVIHGDIKPSNIQIGASDDLRLLDFGIAKIIRPGRDLTHHELGSPGYCSPERLKEYRVDVQADLWAVGITLYEMLVGAPPFQARDTLELERLIQAKPVLEIPASCPPKLASILQKALAPKLEDRFPSAEAFENELRRFLQPASKKFAPKTILRRPVSRPAAGRSPRAYAYPVTAALLAGILAGLLLFLPLAYHLRLEKISRSLGTPKDYSSLGTDDLLSDWRLYQILRSRPGWGRRLVPTEAAETTFRANLLHSAGMPAERFRRSAGENTVNWAQARLCAFYALQLDPVNRAAMGEFHLANGFLALAQRRPDSIRTSYREFRRAAAFLPRSPLPYLGIARLYAYRVHNVGATLAELQRARALDYPLGPREIELEGDAYLYRAEQEFNRARSLPNTQKTKILRWLQLASNDFERARNIYEPINGYSHSGLNLARIDEQQNALLKFETALLEPPSPKPHLVLLKVRFGSRGARGNVRWR